jgi:hypothetical protein
MKSVAQEKDESDEIDNDDRDDADQKKSDTLSKEVPPHSYIDLMTETASN